MSIIIPPKALEAAARAHAKVNEGHDEWYSLHVDKVRASCLAMLQNWPNRKDEWRDDITFDGKPIRYSVIILPLTQKTA